MLEIHGTDDGSSEYTAAKEFAKIAVEGNPTIENDRNLLLHIFPSIQCHGQQPKDIDLLILFADYRQQNVEERIHSFCVTVEVKGHRANDVRFDGTKCIVPYNNKDHDVTNQSEKQKFSVRNYIEKNSKIKPPFVSNLIWLTGVPHTRTPRQDNNILGVDATWGDFCGKLLPGWNGKVSTFHDRNSLIGVCDVFSRKLVASKLDRTRLEKITRTVLDRSKQQYAEKLGQQLLIYHGRGGTGKTVRLLQIAHQAYDEMGLRVILLTYNKALVADIRRLFALLGVKDGIASKSVAIKTIHSFMYQWLLQLEQISKGQDDFIKQYETHKNDALEYLRQGAISHDDIKKAKTTASRDLEWDLILIDEAQDWPANERDIIYKLYEYEKVIIADGVDQLVRGVAHIDWRENIDRSKSQTVPLRKSLRLKSSLCQAVKYFAEKIEYNNWNVVPLHEAHGGKMVIVTGDVLSKKFHNKLQATAEKDGNRAIDMLFCVPPTWVSKTADGHRVSRVAEKYKEWGLDTWDAVDPNLRDEYPTSFDQYRIVQYESCRGLEGWVVVNFAFDEFFEYKKSSAEITDSQKSDMFFDHEEASLEYAKKWIMIPLTRAIDRLVLHVSNEDSYIGKVLMELHDQHPEIIDKYKF